MATMYPFGPMFDPFQRPPQDETRNYVRLVAGLLGDRFRVEIKWDTTEYGMRPPNGELMVGVPDTEWRTYRIVKLPTWATPVQIAGILDAELRIKYQAWASSGSPVLVNPLLAVKGDVGVYEVAEFSTPKVLP